MTRRLILIAATMAAVVTAAPAAAATPTLVGEWRFDDGAGSVAADSSGYGDNGTVLGPAGWYGPDGGGLKFDGGAARIQVPDEPQLDPANSVTVSAWIERTGSPGAYKYVVAGRPWMHRGLVRSLLGAEWRAAVLRIPGGVARSTPALRTRACQSGMGSGT